jgi:ABC-type multidrug transport system fused ATPase/permease subunit
LSNLQVVQAIPGRMMEVFAVLGFFILLLISKLGPGMVQSGSLDVLTIGMFMAAAYKIMPGLVKILNAIGQIHTYDYTIKDLLQTAQQGSKLDQHKDSVKIRSVEFNNISFSYDGHSVLSGFSASMKKSGIIGINGISGKGKTTLINLLLGFVKPDNGTLFFNDQEMCTDSLRQYWPAISYVKQSPFLINDSILKNITLDEFDHDERKMNQVIDECGLRPLLSRYRSGIHHCITENGKDISGGQRQRIALARALYKDADLIILDEPFNELDRASEDDLLRLFTGLAWRGKMILLITHNKESLSHCDKIISLDAA